MGRSVRAAERLFFGEERHRDPRGVVDRHVRAAGPLRGGFVLGREEEARVLIGDDERCARRELRDDAARFGRGPWEEERVREPARLTVARVVPRALERKRVQAVVRGYR